jgi:hypothetical protein
MDTNGRYILKHKNIDVAEISFNEHFAIHGIYKVFNEEHLPLGVINYADKTSNSRLYDWWETRAIPKTRTSVTTLSYMHVRNRDEFLVNTLGFSLSDHYWICPKGKPLQWENKNYYQNKFPDDIGELLFTGYSNKDIKNIDTADGTLNGNLSKRWIIKGNDRYIVKSDSDGSSLNEYFTSKLCNALNIQAVQYGIEVYTGAPVSVCKNMTTNDVEFIPACQVIETLPKSINDSEYEHYIKCVKYLGYANIENDIDNMILIDNLIRNEDRHTNNFGILRNSATLKIVCAAPLFDNGNSLWFKKLSGAIKYDDDCTCKCFKNMNSNNLKLIKDKGRFDLDALEGIENTFLNLQKKYPAINEEKAVNVSNAVRKRITLFNGAFKKLSETNNHTKSRGR